VCVGGKGGQRGGERGKTEKNTYTNYLYAVVNLTQLMIGNEESLYLVYFRLKKEINHQL
jgi:hypothetical protein